MWTPALSGRISARQEPGKGGCAAEVEALAVDGRGLPMRVLFTAGQSGLLTRVAFSLVSPVAPLDSPGVVRLYAGEGTNGPLVSTASVRIAAPHGFQTFGLSI